MESSKLMIMVQKTLKAAEEAMSDDGQARCMDLLKCLKQFPITADVLLSTQIDKRLRHLKKHKREKIRLMAVWLMEVWSKKIKDDRSSSRNKGPGGNKALISTTLHDDLLLFSSSANKRAKLETCPPRKRILLARQDNKKPFKKPLKVRPAPFKCPDDHDALRNKVRDVLLEAFSRVSSEVSRDGTEEVMERVRGCDPVGVAVSVESVLFEKMGFYNGANKFKYGSIMFNLRDPNNPDFRRKLLLGDIKPELLLTMTSEEMASHQRQCLNRQIKHKLLSGSIKNSLPESDIGDHQPICTDSLW